jgi:hypothetical protein
MSRFITAAYRQGAAIEALMDEPTWLLPENRHQLGEYLKAIQTYHAQVPPAARFQAIHLDLEINQLPHWEARKDKVARYLLDTLRYVKSREPTLPLAVDLPVWLDRQGIKLWPEIIRAADRIVFMAYEQKTPDHLVRALHPLLDFCRQEGKPVWIGLNIQDFAGQENGALDRYMSEVDKKISPRVAGFALFQYQDLKRLRLARVTP